MNIEILKHAVHRAAHGFYCGGGKDMDELVAAGLMEYAGRKSFVPDPYYTITAAGRELLHKLETESKQKQIHKYCKGLLFLLTKENVNEEIENER